MAGQLLRSPEVEPTDAVIAQGLGAANNAYLKFIEQLQHHEIELEYRYYTDGNAWLGKGVHRWTGARGGKKEVTAFWLSIWDGFFRVTIYLPEKARAEALTLALSGEIRTMVEQAKQMGKLKISPLVFDLRSDALLDQVYTLIDFRKGLG